MSRGLCAYCGTDLDEHLARRCSCVPPPRSQLERAALGATRLAGPTADLRTLRRALRDAAFHLRTTDRSVS